LKARLTKPERLYSRTLINKLFEPGGGSRSFAAYPIRAVYRLTDKDETSASILISVPKRQFKHAVDRNHVKRQIREAYRQNKQLLKIPDNKSLNIAFVWLSNEHYPSGVVASKVKNLLQRISEACVKC